MELVVDADVLMNLVATEEVAAIFAVSEMRLLICPQVEGEALYLENLLTGSREAIDLAPLVSDGTAVRAALSDAELEQFVALAAQVDDGEAQALAVAGVRGIPVATDDRRAIRVADELGVNCIDTPQLLLRWAETVPSAAAAAALTNVERRARFVPRPSHPLRERWFRLCGRA